MAPTLTMRALLVDDERLVRRELRELLTEGHPEVEIVGEAASVAEARGALARTGADVVFLDVQMPGGSGFDLLAALREETVPGPRVIFVTAYDAHALRAFEFGVVDYLLKPIDPKRLAEALRRLAAFPGTAGDAPAPGVGSPPAGPAPGRVLGVNERVLLREGGRCAFVRVGDLRLLESEGNHARVFFGAETPALIPRSLNALEARLDPAVFFRASRRHLVNLRWVERVEPWFSESLLLVLAGGHRVEMSRRQSQRFQEAVRI